MSSHEKILKKIKKLEERLTFLSVEQEVKVENKLVQCRQEFEPERKPKPKVKDVVFFGRITNCDTGDPMVGAIVKAFKCRKGIETPLVHTFSGCNGDYLLNIPRKMIRPGDEILIKAGCTDKPPSPCECCQNCR